MFDIVKNRKVFYIISAVIILVGIVMMFVQGFTTDTEFMGGVECTVKVNKNVDNKVQSDIASIVEKTVGEKPAIQKSDNTSAVIKLTKELNIDDAKKLKDALVSKLGIKAEDITNFEVVSPAIGKEMQRTAFLAAIVAVLLMLVYIAFRFEFLSGIAAVMALIHDVLIMLTVYVVFKVPVNTSFIAAILTIIGYSINATIVLFDRVRENVRLTKKTPFATIVNTSVWQTMNRSLLTSLTTIVTVVLLYFMGVDSIKEFAFPIIVGVIAGCYSSVFLSGNFWVALKKLAKHKNGQ